MFATNKADFHTCFVPLTNVHETSVSFFTFTLKLKLFIVTHLGMIHIIFFWSELGSDVFDQIIQYCGSGTF
jgi:hypothetical protein